MPLARPQDSDFGMAEATAVRLDECDRAERINLPVYIRLTGGQHAVAKRMCGAVVNEWEVWTSKGVGIHRDAPRGSR
jgi:hypothetical protein